MVGEDTNPAQREGEGGRAPTGAVVAKDEAPVPLRYATAQDLATICAVARYYLMLGWGGHHVLACVILQCDTSLWLLQKGLISAGGSRTCSNFTQSGGAGGAIGLGASGSTFWARNGALLYATPRVLQHSVTGFAPLPSVSATGWRLFFSLQR